MTGTDEYRRAEAVSIADCLTLYSAHDKLSVSSLIYFFAAGMGKGAAYMPVRIKNVINYDEKGKSIKT